MFDMANKDRHTKEMLDSLRRIIHKHLLLNEYPLKIDGVPSLTPREIHFIQAIGENIGSNVKDLAGILGVTKSAASQMIRKLEAKKIVRKEKSCNNDKEIIVSLTIIGEKAFNINKDFNIRHINKLENDLRDFSDSQILMTSSILSIVEETVDRRIAEFKNMKGKT